LALIGGSFHILGISRKEERLEKVDPLKPTEMNKDRNPYRKEVHMEILSLPSVLSGDPK
jgi:hypothetical protein